MRALHLFIAFAASALLLAAPAAATATATPLTLQLLNRGNDAGSYGLRLDGLHDGNPSSVNTFDFEADGAEMWITWDSEVRSLRIHGTAVGVGSQSAPSFYDIDFLYTDVAFDEMCLHSDHGSGTIHLQGGETIELASYSSGQPPHHFYAGFGYDRVGGPFGWGSLHQETALRGSNELRSEWNFEIGRPIPEPGAVLVFGVGLLLTAGVLRRRS